MGKKLRFGYALCGLVILSLKFQVPLELGKKFDPATDASWKLVWSEEFEGKSLNLDNWKIKEGKKRPLGDGLPDIYLTKENIYLDGQGNAVIKYSFDNKGDIQRAECQSKKLWLYGYYEARVKFSKEPGWWAAFWLWPPGDTFNPALNGIELDIFEDFYMKSQHKNVIQHAIHTGDPSRFLKTRSWNKTVLVPGDWNDFHTVGVKWSPFEYVFYVDGKATCRYDYKQVFTTKPSQIFLSVCSAGGGTSWAGYLRDAKLPDYFVIDYVRVYKRKNAVKPPVISCKSSMGDSLFVKENTKFRFFATISGKQSQIEKVCLFDNGYLLESRVTPPYEFEGALSKQYYADKPYMSRGEGTLYGLHAFQLAACKSDGTVGWTEPKLVIVRKEQKKSSPYKGKAQTIPGVIEFEFFDEGGKDVAYYDIDKNVFSDSLRPNDEVDVSAQSIGHTKTGEYINYTVDIKQSGTYTVTLSYASGRAHDKKIALFLDNKFIGEISCSSGDDWAKHLKAVVKGIELPEGQHVLTVLIIGGLVNLDYLEFKAE